MFLNAKNCRGTRDKKWSYKFEDLSKAAHVKWFILSLLSLFLLLSFWKISVRFRVFKMSQLDTIGKIKMLNEVVTNLLIWMWSIQSTTKSKTTKNCMHTCKHAHTDAQTHTETQTHTLHKLALLHLDINCQQSGMSQDYMLDVNYPLHTHKKGAKIYSSFSHKTFKPSAQNLHKKKVTMHIKITTTKNKQTFIRSFIQNTEIIACITNSETQKLNKVNSFEIHVYE